MTEEERLEWSVYLDVCSLNRPFDDQSQDRIRLESEAVILVMRHCNEGGWRWLTSDIVTLEVQKSPVQAKRERVQRMIEFAQTVGEANAQDIGRGQYLEKLGFATYDALHIACAERGQADVLLTTDDRFVRLGKRYSNELKVRVENPLTWIQEVL